MRHFLPTARSNPRLRPSDRPLATAGFTLVETMVVLVIVGILIAVAATSMHGGKSAGGTAIVVATADAYSQAIDAYGLDHRGVLPVSIGGTGWPVINDGPTDPMARSANAGRYLKTLPESVGDKHVLVGSASTPTDGFAGYIMYRRAVNQTDFELRVLRSDNKYVCSYGSALPPSSIACS